MKASSKDKDERRLQDVFKTSSSRRMFAGGDSFFISPTHYKKMSNIIFSVDNHKTIGPNSILTKTLKFLNKDISNQLASLFNPPLLSGIFPNFLKLVK